MRLKELKIEERGLGWYRTAISHPVYVEKVCVTWRTQIIECCQQVIVLANNSRVPVTWNGDFELQGHIAQCRQCGATHEARFTRKAC